MKTTIAELVGFVSVEDWCLYEGTTRSAIDIRVSRGHWQRGIHIMKPKGGKSMVRIKAAKEWLEKESSRKA